MHRVLHDGYWRTFCPHEVKTVMGFDLNELYGSDFTNAYRKCESAAESGRLTIGAKYKAKELLKELLKTQVETGLPYVFFSDTVHKVNPNKHDKIIVNGEEKPLSIQSLNLCVTGDTKILTDKGYLPIGDLVGTYQTVWNGEEWSEGVKIVQTGENLPILEVTTDSGHVVKCTPYHKFAVSRTKNGASRYTREIVEVRAHELKPGDNLIKFDLPVIEGELVLKKAYTNGFFSADGTEYNGRKMIGLYGDKIKLKEFIEFDGNWTNEAPLFSGVQKTRTSHIDGLIDKFFVPDASYTIQSRIEWLSGLFDGDTTYVANFRSTFKNCGFA